jgi:thiopeptide-type bacteriocin biosynthesis protein
LNVIKRPALHRYEIPYLSTSCLEPSFQIQPSELMVSSPDGLQIILTCPRLGKRIIPRLTSAHNYTDGLPFYRFLCELSQQTDGAYLNWDWHQTLDEPFFPRITFKHLILQKASWQLDGKIHEKLTGNADAVLAAWESICQQLAIPRYVQIQLGDNELLIDGQCIFSLQLLCSYLKKTSKLTLVEYLGRESSGFLMQDDKSLDHEIIIPFLNCGVQKEIKSHIISDHSEPVIYNLGSDWLYLKIYCSAQTADYLLIKIVYPFCTRLINQGLIQKWFYIRYFDPQGHLRIRLNLVKKKGIWCSVLQKFHSLLDPFLSSGLITALKTDSYEREMERYPFMAYSKLETLFSIDSICTSKCLALLSEQADPNLKWLLALKGCDQLLDDLGLNECEKSQVIKELYNQFKVILDKKYRKFRPLITTFLSSDFSHLNGTEVFVECFDHRTLGIQQVLSTVDQLSRKALQELATNLVHLFLNRWFHTEQRRQEWVLYHFLKKYYDTILNFSKTRKNELQSLRVSPIIY